MRAYRHRRGGLGDLIDSPVEATGPEKNHKWKIEGNPWQTFCCQVWCAPLPLVGPPRAGNCYIILLHHMYWSRGGEGVKIWASALNLSTPVGHPWHILASRGSLYPCWLALWELDTRLVHPHLPTNLDLLLYPPLPCKASRQGGGYHWW